MKIAINIVLTLLLFPVWTYAEIMTLQWNDNSNNECGFTVERKVETDATFAVIGWVNSSTTSTQTYQDTGLTPTLRYCYQVRAFNSGGESAPSNVACQIPVTPDVIAPPPTGPPLSPLAACFSHVLNK